MVRMAHAQEAALDAESRLVRGESGFADKEELAEFVMLLLEAGDLRPEGGNFLFQLIKF